MVTFIVSLILLILGYFVYGKFVEHIFGADFARKTPCYAQEDGIDYIPMPTWKVYLIQFLNIAGTGPIFGAIQGILFGPAAYFWIILGCIFGGAVHDYMSGMMSLRRGGESLPEMVGSELGRPAKVVMLIFAMVLMVLVGAVFTKTPAGLLASICTPETIADAAATVGSATATEPSIFASAQFWVFIILAYYVLATLLPIDKLIGRIYPLFGLALLIMAIGLFFGIFFSDGSIPEITEAFSNHHPHADTVPLFPCLCITIACGAVSGFHATQSPMMARCLKNEKYGRGVFYGAMITEGIVALIWASASIKFADSLNVAGNTPYEKLLTAMTEPNGSINPAIIVNNICHSWLGSVGGVLAILGVVAAPITTGDTAFRSARLIAADFLKIKQDKIIKRILLCLPIFMISIVLIFVDFAVLWRYFAWFNQTLSVFTFWAITVYLAKLGKPYIITLIPGMFMTCVCSTYILVAPEGFQLPTLVADLGGLAITLVALAGFIFWLRMYRKHPQLMK